MTPEENLIVQTAKVSDTVLSATSSLIKYLEGHTSKTEVINPVESVSTPDVHYVVEALQVLDTTLKTHENTDLSPVTILLQQLVHEASLIPKEHPEDTTVDYSTQFSELTSGVKRLETAIKAQKLVAEAPVVNVPAPEVHVAAPDLKPLQTASKQLETTVKLGQEEMRQLASKSGSAIITEQFDEYKIKYSVKFDDDEPTVVSAIDYLFNGKKVASLKYTYDKEGNLLGGKKV